MKLTRRLAMKLLLLSAPLFFLASTAAPQKRTPNKPYLVFVGTYTNKTASKGIYAYLFDPGIGKLSSLGVAAESEDPSFLAVHPSGKFLYAVNEIDHFGAQKSGAVSAFSIDTKTGKLTLLNQAATRGVGPCHVSLDKTGKFVLVATYDGGSIATFPIRDDGSLGEVAGFVQHYGSSVNKERQEAPHSHWIGVSPDNRFAIEANLGLDELPVYHFNARNGDLSPIEPFVKLNPGAGPRHLAFHPNGKFAYVLAEMESSVTAFAYKASNGSLSPLQTLSTLSIVRKDDSGPKEAAEIVVHPNGKFLYASNRANIDTISTFSIDPAKGTLKLKNEYPTMGKTPRNFAIDPTGKFLLAANQESNNIVIFRIDSTTGTLTPTGEITEVPAPVCITFVAVTKHK
jgi:6-phosphogluconolactonase